MSDFTAKNFLPRVNARVDLVPWNMHHKDAGRRITNAETGAIVADEREVSQCTHTGRRPVQREDEILLGVHSGKVGSSP